MRFRKCWPHKGRHGAKAERLTVSADASENDEKLVASVGADIVVRRGDDVASRIRSHFAQGVGGLADGAIAEVGKGRSAPAAGGGRQNQASRELDDAATISARRACHRDDLTR
jgi:hypothetical protein